MPYDSPHTRRPYGYRYCNYPSSYSAYPSCSLKSTDTNAPSPYLAFQLDSYS